MQPEFFRTNRQKIIASSQCELIILSANTQVQRHNDMAYGFSQESNFWYLTGIEQADWWVVIERDKTSLIAPDVDEVHRVFDGTLSNIDAQEVSGVDQVLTHAEGVMFLEKLKEQYEEVETLGEDPHKAHYDFVLNPGPVEMHAMLGGLFKTVIDCRKDLAKLRAIKQQEEIEATRRAIKLTNEAFEKVKAKIETYKYEYEIEADFTHHFRYSGSEGHAYDPIVAGGKNACTLHYGYNNDPLSKGDFLLLDIGASVDGYAADITRTYAIGEVSDRHKDVHAAVEEAHIAIISLLKPGLDVREYNDQVDEIMKDALKSLGLLNKESDYRTYFPHAISHGLGIDVHDSLGGPETFQPGMVLTVEPGIYIPEEGIGVRIEDDILITENGNENLSGSLSTAL